MDTRIRIPALPHLLALATLAAFVLPPATASWTIPVDADVETGIVDAHVHEEVTLTDVDDPQPTVDQAVADAQQEAADAVEAVGDAQAFVASQVTCVEDPRGGATVIIPPGAAAAPLTVGFAPPCAVVESQTAATFQHADSLVGHDPASDLDDEQIGTAARCFQSVVDLGGSMTMTNGRSTYTLNWRYDGTTVEVSLDGTTWEDCNDAMDTTLSTAGVAVVPYRCEIHDGMRGTFHVHANTDDGAVDEVVAEAEGLLETVGGEAAAAAEEAQETANETADLAVGTVQPFIDLALAAAGGALENATELQEFAVEQAGILLAMAQQFVDEQTETQECRRFEVGLAGDGLSVIPPLAFSDPTVQGFLPRCVIVDDDSTFRIVSADPIPHNPGSLNDAGSPLTRCFSFSRDVHPLAPANNNQVIGTAIQTLWDYDGTTLRASTNGGATWFNCDAAMDPALSDSSKAVVPYRCDIHTNMRGTVVVEA